MQGVEGHPQPTTPLVPSSGKLKIPEDSLGFCHHGDVNLRAIAPLVVEIRPVAKITFQKLAEV